MVGTLFVVATPIGNLEDITARALRVLREVAVIAAEDTRRTSHLLTRYGIPTPTTSLHEHNERSKTGALLARLLAGESVALVSDAGTPTVSDPGRYLIATAVQAGVKVEPIPGANAAVAAVSVSAMAGDAFTFLGFPPIRSKDRKEWMDRLVASGPVAVFYEAPHRIRQTLEEISRVVGDVEVLVARELTKVHEELVRGPISTVLARVSSPLGEFTVVVNLGLEVKPAVLDPGSEAGRRLIADEFGHMTSISGKTRRQAISYIAKRYGVSAKAVYSAIEEAKFSGC